MNRCIFVGRLTAEPQFKQTQQGVAVSTFTLAVNRGYKKNEENLTDFIYVVAWRERAKFVAAHLHKGTKIVLEAKARTRRYEQDGQTHFITEFHADDIEFVESAAAKNTQSIPPVPDGFTDIDDADLPWN